MFLLPRVFILTVLFAVVDFDFPNTTPAAPQSSNASASPTTTTIAAANSTQSPPIDSRCVVGLRAAVVGFVVVLSAAAVLELTATGVSMRGTILDAAPRSPMKYLLYARLGE